MSTVLGIVLALGVIGTAMAFIVPRIIATKAAGRCGSLCRRRRVRWCCCLGCRHEQRVPEQNPMSSTTYTKADLDAAVAAETERCVAALLEGACPDSECGSETCQSLHGIARNIRARGKAPDATLPPEVLASALQDRIHPTSGRLLGASPVTHREPDAMDLAAWRKSQPALFPPDATPHREPPPAEALWDARAPRNTMVGEIIAERDAMKAEVSALNAALEGHTSIAVEAFAEVERLKKERAQDVAVRREQCEALDRAEKATFAAIDRHQVAHARAEKAEAERDAALAEVASLKAYARNQGDAIAGDLRFQHKLAAALKAARDEAERLKAITNTLTKMPTYGDFADVHSDQMWISRELLASVTRMAERLGEQVKKFTAERDTARRMYDAKED